MQFRTTIRSSIFNPIFYRSLAHRPLRFSLQYFVLLGIVLGIVFSFFFSWAAIPALNLFMANAGRGVIQNFPSDLTITIKSGVASTNVTEPYAFPLPAELRPASGTTKVAPANLFVIDTREDVSVEKFKEYNAYFLLTKTHIISGTDDRVVRESLPNTADLSLDREDLQMFAAQLNELARWLAPVVVIGSFLFYLFIHATYLLYAFLGAVFVLLLARRRHIKTSFGGAYRMAVHAMTPGILISFILTPVSFENTFGFFFIILFVLTAWFNLPRFVVAPTEAPPVA